MEAKEFTVFRSLLADVYFKAFGEQLSTLSHGKAQTLSWIIQESTGEPLSHKTLGSYFAAALANNHSLVNPTDAALSVLAQFVVGEASLAGRQKMRMGAYAPWYKYRSSALMRA